MAPEQARGDVSAIGPPTDVWALGAMLYTLLVGRPPFEGDSIMSILRRVESEEPPAPSQLPRDLAAIVMRCLEKAPERRYPSAGDLARDLKAFERSEPVVARHRPWGRWLRRVARGRLALAALPAIAAVAAPVWWWALRAPSRDWHAEIALIPPSYEEDAEAVRVSPDGKQLLFSSSRGGDRKLYLQPAEGGPARPLAGTEKGAQPRWSSSGDSIYFVVGDQLGTQIAGQAGTHIEKLPLHPPGPPVRVLEAHDWVECGGRIFFARKAMELDRLFTVEPGGAERELAHSDRTLRDLSCSADGRRVAYVTGVEAEKVAWLDVEERVEHFLPTIGDNSRDPAFHPLGRSLIVTVRSNQGNATLWEQRLDGRRVRQLTTGGHESSACFASDGRLFFSIGEITNILSAYPLDGASPRRLGESAGWEAVEPTPGGTHLISGRGTPHGSEIVELNVKDESQRVLGSGEYPVVSLAARQIYFLGEDHRSLWSMPVEGGPRHALGQAPAVVDNLYPGVDALHLLLAGATRAWRQPYDGSPGGWEGPPGIRMLMPAADGWTLAWGPHWEAIVWPPGPEPTSAPAPTRLHNPVFTPDRRSFLAWDDDYWVWLVNLASGKEQKLVRVPNVQGANLSLDGKVLYTHSDLNRTQRAIIRNYGALPPF
jgi:hypothetical protein